MSLFGPCAKRRMQAVLTGASGRVYAAENVCLNPQPVCPREPGEGYDKCKSVCQQIGHGEAQVIAAAASDARGGRLVISHWYACPSCEVLCRAVGIQHIEYTSPVDSERTA
jgi:deoxycytidylate deaminase